MLLNFSCQTWIIQLKIWPKRAQKYFFLIYIFINIFFSPLKIIFSLDLAHSQKKIQVFFCLYLHFFLWENYHPLPKKSLGEANSVLGGGIVPLPRPPKNVPGYSMTFSLRSNELVTLLTTKLRGKNQVETAWSYS